jgi:hypothetical protein
MADAVGMPEKKGPKAGMSSQTIAEPGGGAICTE